MESDRCPLATEIVCKCIFEEMKIFEFLHVLFYLINMHENSQKLEIQKMFEISFDLVLRSLLCDILWIIDVNL